MIMRGVGVVMRVIRVNVESEGESKEGLLYKPKENHRFPHPLFYIPTLSILLRSPTIDPHSPPITPSRDLR